MVRRRFTNPQAIALLVILVAGFLILYFLHGILTPLLVAIVLAYLLEWPTARLQRIGCSRNWAASMVMIMFAGIAMLLVFVVAPTAWQQGINLMTDSPGCSISSITSRRRCRSVIRRWSMPASSI